MKTVFLSTAQFSGTRFLHYTVTPASNHPQWQQSKIKIIRIKNGLYKATDTFILKNNYIFARSLEGLIGKIKKRLSEQVKNPDNFVASIVAHFGNDGGFIPFNEQERLMDIYPTAITLRDPLAIILTTEGRRQGDIHHLTSDNYVALAQSKKSVFYVPVDLYKHKSLDDRKKLICNLFSFLGITPSDSGYIDNIVAEWKVRGSVLKDKSMPVENRKYASLLRCLYDEGDIKQIRKIVPNCYAELKRREPIIRPLLEQVGYKNLIWWEA